MKTKFYLIIFTIVSLLTLCQAKQKEYTISEIGKCKTGVAYDVFAVGNYAYATTNTGVAIIDVNDKTRPKEIGKIKTKNPSFGVCVQSEKIFFVAMDGEFIVANNQPPEKPEIVGKVNGLDRPYKIDVKDSYAYITQDNGKLVVLFYKYFLFLVATNPSAFSVISPHLPTEIRISKVKRHSHQLKMRNKSSQDSKPPI